MPSEPGQEYRQNDVLNPLWNMLDLTRRDAEPSNQGWTTADTGRAAALRSRFMENGSGRACFEPPCGLVDKRRCQEKAPNEDAALWCSGQRRSRHGACRENGLATADTKHVGFLTLMLAQAQPVSPQASSEARR